MTDDPAIVALLRRTGLHGARAVARIEAGEESAANAVPPDQARLFDTDSAADTDTAADTDGRALARAAADLRQWHAAGLRLVTAADVDYPVNLHGVHDRPAAVFLAGALTPDDEQAVAIVGTRRPSERGLSLTRELADAFARAGVTVVSGLATGIDTAAHEAALAAGGRTVAVIGTGLAHAYPPANAALQRRLASEHAVVSPFWPETTPDAETFRTRNAVMSGLARGTVIVEASVRSGTRVQARRALAHGRPVFLTPGLLDQRWASELAARPGVHVAGDADDVLAVLHAVHDSGPPSG